MNVFQVIALVFLLGTITFGYLGRRQSLIDTESAKTQQPPEVIIPVTLKPETTAQRYLRTEKEWYDLSRQVEDEQTTLKLKKDVAFQEFMDAKRALEAEAAKP
jgi:hypothetical protein